MLYFKINDKLEPVEVARECPEELKAARRAGEPSPWACKPGGVIGAGWISRSDFDGGMWMGGFLFNLAAKLSQMKGRDYIAIDDGRSVSPRYDVIEAPMVGDDVSKSFNGDSYPVGKIVSITKNTMRCIKVRDESGRELKFWRQVESGRWVQSGGTWSLIPGAHNERNPHF